MHAYGQKVISTLGFPDEFPYEQQIDFFGRRPSALGGRDCSKYLVFCPGNDFILKVFVDVQEVVAIACYSYDEISVFFRIFLGISQSLSSDHIELNMVAVKFKKRTYEIGQLVYSIFGG